MKFINYLKGIEGVSIFPLIALLLFFIVFVGVAITLITARKDDIDHAKNLPISKGTE